MQVKSRVAVEGYPAFLLLGQVSGGVLDRIGRNVRRIEFREGNGDFLVDRHEASVVLPLEDLVVVASFFRPGAVAEGEVDKSAIGSGDEGVGPAFLERHRAIAVGGSEDAVVEAREEGSFRRDLEVVLDRYLDREVDRELEPGQVIAELSLTGSSKFDDMRVLDQMALFVDLIGLEARAVVEVEELEGDARAGLEIGVDLVDPVAHLARVEGRSQGTGVEDELGPIAEGGEVGDDVFRHVDRVVEELFLLEGSDVEDKGFPVFLEEMGMARFRPLGIEAEGFDHAVFVVEDIVGFLGVDPARELGFVSRLVDLLEDRARGQLAVIEVEGSFGLEGGEIGSGLFAHLNRRLGAGAGRVVVAALARADPSIGLGEDGPPIGFVMGGPFVFVDVEVIGHREAHRIELHRNGIEIGFERLFGPGREEEARHLVIV